MNYQSMQYSSSLKNILSPQFRRKSPLQNMTSRKSRIQSGISSNNNNNNSRNSNNNSSIFNRGDMSSLSNDNIYDFQYNYEKYKNEQFKDYSNRLDESLAQYYGVDKDELFKNLDQLPIIIEKDPYIPKRETLKIKRLYDNNKYYKMRLNGESNNSLIKINISNDINKVNEIGSYKNKKNNESNLPNINASKALKNNNKAKRNMNHKSTNRNKNNKTINNNINDRMDTNDEEKKGIYSDPYDSLKVIRKNHQVYDEICKSFFQRQQLKMDEKIEFFKGMAMKFNVRMPKIRVNNLANKNFFGSDENEDNLLDGETDSPEVEKKDKGSKNLETEHTHIIPNRKGSSLSSFGTRLLSYYKYPNVNFPEGREQFSICLYENDLLLYGGLSSTINLSSIWTLNLESLKWQRLESKSNQTSSLRYGHTTCTYKDKLYVFGGRNKLIDCTEFADIDVYNISTKVWSTPYFKDTIKPPMRRNHIGEFIGGYYLIQGGMAIDGEILNDCFILNFNILKWVKGSFAFDMECPSLFGHCSATVLPMEIRFNSRFNIFKFPEVEIKRKEPCFIPKEKGIYMFGGRTPGEGISNDMYVINIGKKIFECKKIETKGIKPLERYLCSMSYYEKGNYLIIHGGRNDFHSDSFALSDTFMLRLNNFEWLKVDLVGLNPKTNFNVYSRCGHASLIYSNKLIIFGGMNCHNMLGFCFLVVNLIDESYLNKQKNDFRKYRKELLNNYPICLQEKQQMARFIRLMSKNQLEVLPEYSSLPNIK